MRETQEGMKKIFIPLLLFALLGLIGSILMTQLHYRMGGLGFEEKSFCHVSEFFDCDTALASRYSRIGPFLTSEIGILYYLLLFLGIFFAWASEKNRNGTLGFFFFVALFAFGHSLVLAYLSFYKLGVLCLLCLMTYVANLFSLLLIPKALSIRYLSIPSFLIRYVRSIFICRRPVPGPPEFRPRLFLHLTLTLLVIGVGLLFFLGLNPEIRKVRAEVPREAYLQFYRAIPKKEFVLPARPFWGSPSAPVTIVEFSDFQCPYCRVAAFTLKPYLKEFRNKVRLIFLNYPLDSACNPALSHSAHPVSCLAAKAALCADRQGKFWDTHDLIFENQKRLSRDTLLRLAGKVGLDLSRFDQCLVSDEIASLLKEDVELGNRLEVHGTPAVFVNGRPFRDWSNPEILRMVIESEIAGTSSLNLGN